MLYLQKKYLNLLSGRFDGFVWKSANTANLRCFACGDSSKNKRKKRGYFYEKDGSLWYKCHNCPQMGHFKQILKDLDPNLYKEYVMECYKGGDRGRRKLAADPVPKSRPSTLFTKEHLDLPSIASLPSEHHARQYIEGRKIPPEFYPDLYYCEAFGEYIKKFPGNDEFKLKAQDPRIVIPFYDQQKNLVAFQGRALSVSSTLRYITIKIDKDAPKIFGLDRYDVRKPGYVFEGPFDSMFVSNSLANASADIGSVGKFVDKNNTTFVGDNQPRNNEVVRIAERILAEGYKIFVWPEHVVQKDVNDLAKSGYTKEAVLNLLNTNTFTGLTAKLKLQNWKKC